MNKTLLKPQVLIALLAAGTMVFHSCKDKNEVIQDDPGATPAESVKTSFAFNIPYVGKNTPRMSGTNTQSGGNFIGMHNIYLASMENLGADHTTLTTCTNLGDITGALDDGHRKVYNNVSIPIGTTHFLFYATGGTTPGDKFQNGTLTSTLAATNATTDDITFKLEHIYTGAGIETDAGATALLDALNAVANVDDWKEHTDVKMASLYNDFTSLKSGSAASIKATLAELKTTLTPLNTDPVAADIIAEIDNQTVAIDGVTFPRNLNLPDGVAQIAFTENNPNGSFAYVTPDVINPVNISPANICYPASLNYMANTEAKVTPLETVAWPATADLWQAEAWTGWGTAVQADTRIIALKDNIQYSVANLKTTVKCANGTLQDKKGKDVTVDADGFPVTGVLIGGQPTTVGWDFLAENTDGFTNTIYDNAVSMNAKTDNTGGENYTLVLDNSAAPDASKTVQIAIELENNTGAAFYGLDGKIPNGGRFYLIAKLDPDPAAQGGTDVFLKDYVTTANLTIQSLQNAYVTIPDLRVVEMQLGLSVELTWQAGLVFNIDIN